MSIEERVRRGLTKEESAHQAAIPLASWWAEFVGGKMTYEEAVKTILPGRYRHFKGNEYEVIAIARHSDEAAAVLRAISPERVLAAAEPFLPPSQP